MEWCEHLAKDGELGLLLEAQPWKEGLRRSAPPMAYCVLLVAKARSIKKAPKPGCASEPRQSMACIVDTGVAPSPGTMNWRGHIPMCPMILPAERAMRLQTESPEGPLGPSKYFHERTS